ncbi:hypothetical protein XENTR_v10022450 [Xenopus tropicalis]|uniref:Leucine-rich repeat-containing protein 71 isoform X1 n=1 Tax=Xenopus tropicalis TaxID=8364 RepID=A0A8J0R6U8_XENTR|nr:leucine-rich repeat-containing protein 71 isoform X1 [Xenopus tropicalis]KAE8588291.1 hypothetical protein XENTR_v10022450 [Xenopus tropicalis]KAE8588292.1 hypothetical protein XENTR_v10022450 [Xenopus tropicalis]
MGKKSEKAQKDKVAAGNAEDESRNSANASMERASLTVGDYQCTGILEQDFPELCGRAGFTESEIPRVTLCHRTAVTPTSEKNAADDSDGASDKDNPGGGGPTKDKFSYFKPKIEVETEGEDGKSVKVIFVHGWKIDHRMMGIFSKCLPALTALQGISLWNVALTESTFSQFLEILPHCPNIKTVVLEGNPLPEQSYYKLISDHLPLVRISLRNNMITDDGAKLISQALQSLKTNNKNLATLNLSFNHISDLGAGYLAEALRMDRSLLCLDLSHNQIGDQGTLALAEVLGPFPLTHKEIVERRRLLMDKDSHELQRSPTLSRNGDARNDRPQSHQSYAAVEKPEKAPAASKTNKSMAKKKDKDKDPQKKEEKSTTSLQGGNSTVSGQGGQAKKEDPKAAKKQLPNPEQKNSKVKPVRSASKRVPLTEHELHVEPAEITHPLLEPAESRDGKVFLPGNRVLINLNLLRNRITEKGLNGLLAAVEAQESKLIPGSKSHTGLLRLCVGKNLFPPDNETFIKLQELMLSRDPIHKLSRLSADEQTQ